MVAGELGREGGDVGGGDVWDPAVGGRERRIVRLLDQEVATLKAIREAAADVRPGDRVPLEIRRGGETRTLTLTAGEGL